MLVHPVRKSGGREGAKDRTSATAVRNAGRLDPLAGRCVYRSIKNEAAHAQDVTLAITRRCDSLRGRVRHSSNLRSQIPGLPAKVGLGWQHILRVQVYILGSVPSSSGGTSRHVLGQSILAPRVFQITNRAAVDDDVTVGNFVLLLRVADVECAFVRGRCVDLGRAGAVALGMGGTDRVIVQ
jgi:hypothetical protein